MTNQQIVGLIGQQKGGSGKTTFADILNAVCQAAGKDTLVVDVDDGNSGFIRRCGKGSALSLSWSQPRGGASAWIDSYIKGKDIVLFDLGANLFASGAPVTEFLAEVVTHFQASGARIVFFAVASTNSPGCGRLVAEMRNDFGLLGDVRVVENNTDGSGAFPSEITTLGMPRVKVEHIDPGIQAVRLLRQEHLLDVLSSPPAGYARAMALYAKKVLAFAEQETVMDIAGGDSLRRLRELAQGSVEQCFLVRDFDTANDQTMEANAAYGQALRALRRVDQGDCNEVNEKALQFISAANDYFSN